MPNLRKPMACDISSQLFLSCPKCSNRSFNLTRARFFNEKDKLFFICPNCKVLLTDNLLSDEPIIEQ